MVTRRMIVTGRNGSDGFREWRLGPAAMDGARLWTLGTLGARDATAIREPAVARRPGASAAPLFSFTLLLARQPAADESSIAPLVRGGTCAITFDVTPTDAELAHLVPDGGVPPAALFLRGMTVALVRVADGSRIAEASSEGFGGRVAIRTTLDEADATAVLHALNGEPCGVEVVADVSYRTPQTVSPPFSLDVEQVLAFLDRYAADDRTFLEVDLLNYFALMIEESIILPRDQVRDTQSFVKEHFRELLAACGPILRRVRDLETRFWLAESAPAHRPQSTVASGSPMRTLTLTRALDAVLQPLVRRYSIDALVTAVCPSPAGGMEPIGARITRTRTQIAMPGLASFGDRAIAMNVLLRTGSGEPVEAATLARSGLAGPPSPQGHWTLYDFLHGPLTQADPMPQIDDGNALLWADRLDASRFWYAPELVVVAPDARDTPSSSPFLFSFTKVKNDETGQTELEATIRIRLRARMPDATQRVWETQGKPSATPVPLNGLTVLLEVPFVDATGRTRPEPIRAAAVTSIDSDYDATFVLIDQWARLAYGAIALGSSDHAARIVSNYAFTAYVRRPRPLSMSPRQVIEMSVMREKPTLPPAPVILFPHTNIPAHGASSIHIGPPGTTFPVATHVTQTQGRTSSDEVSFPCSTFGALYVQAIAGELKSIGCQNAFTTSVFDQKLFEPLALDFGTNPPFKTWRSLQVPGRFLVVPTSYAVARFEPGDSRAFRPALFLFANVDAGDRDRTRCVVMATLQPCVSAFWRDALVAKLQEAGHSTPELLWPADLDAAPHFDWALSGLGPASADVDAVLTPEGFQVSVATTVDGVLLLKSMIERSGVMGTVTVTLNDGTVIRSSLVLDLAHVTGPFRAGPVEIALDGTRATLTNRIEQPVDVGSLAVRVANRRTTVNVEKRLAPAGSVTVVVPAAATSASVEALPVGEATSFEEVRTYVEDIYVTVVFFANVDFTNVEPFFVDAMIAGVPGSLRVSLSAETPRAEVTFLLPLTTYISQPTVRFAITSTPRVGPAVAGPWRDWRLDTLGNVVEIKTSTLP